MQQFLVRQKDLVDEIDVFDALGLEKLDLFKHGVRGTPPIFVAKVLLGTKRAAIGASARGFDFGSRTDRLCVKAMVVMSMPLDHCVGPCKRRLIDKGRSLRPADDPD